VNLGRSGPSVRQYLVTCPALQFNGIPNRMHNGGYLKLISKGSGGCWYEFE